MCDIPLELERRFERRWAARFSGPAKEHRLEPQQQHQRVTARRRGTGGLASADLSPGPFPKRVSWLVVHSIPTGPIFGDA
jgi:hypothetical protein